MAAHGPWLRYDPQPDITTWELAQSVYVVIHAVIGDPALPKIFDRQVPEVKRHFKDLRDPEGN